MNKYNIENIALDLDGTLLTDKHTIMPKTKAALIEAQERGYKVIIATGRPYETLISFAEELKLKEFGGLIICNNGGQIVDPATDETIYEDLLSKEEARKILITLKDFSVYPFFRHDNYLYVNNRAEAVVDSKSHMGMVDVYDFEKALGGYKIKEKEPLEDNVPGPIFKVLAAGDGGYIMSNIDKINEALDDDLYAVATMPFVIELLKKTVSKGNALAHMGIDLNKTIAFGDSMNDLHMIEEVKYGIAMENAMEILKSIATDQTDSNNNEGIYNALKKYEII